MGDLRDHEEVVPNPNRHKHQITLQGFEFDIYTERQSKLIVPYADIEKHAVSYGELKVACLEHVLPLKLEAYNNRRNSSKGMKDAKDIFRIFLCAQVLGFQTKRYALYKMDTHEGLLEEIIKGPAAVELAQGNSHVAKNYRAAGTTLLEKIKKV